MNKLILLSKLVFINSSFPNEENIGNFLFNYLSDLNLSVKKQKISKKRFNILASKGIGKKSILFYGHMDTIPVVNKSEWKTNPFKLTIKGKKGFGLGAYDMKGGISAFINAIRNTKAYVKVLLAVDEENISEGAWRAIKEQRSFFNDVELIISAEPNLGLNINSVTIGRTGRYIFETDFQGKMEHISKYKDAVDAIELLSLFVLSLYNQREKIFKSKDSTIQVRKISGESIGMSVCDKASCEIELLLGHKDNIEKVKELLQKMTTTEIKLKKRKTPYLSGYYFDSFPYKTRLAKILKKRTKKKMNLVTRSSVGDDNVLALLGIPVITLGPLGGNAHKANEYINIDSLNMIINIYKELLKHHAKIVSS